MPDVHRFTSTLLTIAAVLNDNLAYSRVVLKMGFRTNARESDLSEILPEEIEAAVKAAAEDGDDEVIDKTPIASVATCPTACRPSLLT